MRLDPRDFFFFGAAVSAPLSVSASSSASPRCAERSDSGAEAIHFRRVGLAFASSERRKSVPQMKDAIRLIDPVPVVDFGQVAFVKWLAEYYAASLGDALATALPAAHRRAVAESCSRNRRFSAASFT